MELSSAGTEWLILCSGLCGPTGLLHSMTVGTFTPSLVSPLPGAVQNVMFPVPSESVAKAYLVSGTSGVVPVFTDPAGPPSSLVTLPIAAIGNYRVLTNR